jgi:hypothetical protein
MCIYITGGAELPLDGPALLEKPDAVLGHGEL